MASPMRRSRLLKTMSEVAAVNETSWSAWFTPKNIAVVSGIALLSAGVIWWRFGSSGGDRPLSRTPSSSSLLGKLDLRYHGDRLIDPKTDEPFFPQTQQEFAEVCLQVNEDAQEELRHLLSEVWLPTNALPLNGCNIFLSEGWKASQKLVVIVQDQGLERPGLWSRRHTVLVSRSEGSMLPFVRLLLDGHYGVIITNPNTSYVGQGSTKALIEGSETPERHLQYVCDHFLALSDGPQIVFLAVGCGGSHVIKLLLTRGDLMERVAGLAFVNSLHVVDAEMRKRKPKVAQFIKDKCTHWVASDLPLGTEILDESGMSCTTLSAGSPVNARCIATASPAIMKFLAGLPSTTRSPSRGMNSFLE